MRKHVSIIDRNRLVISIRGLEKSFGSNKVLQGINLDVHKGEEVDKAVKQVLEDVGLSKTINQMPAELSGGQRKRIGIARTLILQPEIMLYDEPTAGLDPITSIDINNLINEVQKLYHTSSIIITHDLTCAKTTGDRVAIMVEGKFFREGSFEEVFDTSDERVKSFYDYNFKENQ